ncbi:MAG: AAA family ATPase [Kiritimatiellae bacterium]|nr:AAA family ATPase [Kiritimatiellia bacterium]
MKDQKSIPHPEPLKQLISVMGNGAVKIITGLRRCGKSYLLNTIFRDYRSA